MAATDTTQATGNEQAATPPTLAVVAEPGSAAAQFGHVRIDTLTDVFATDGSKVIDPAKASAIFDKALPEMASWVEGHRMVRGATARYCSLSFDLRVLCLTDKQAIDWAGNTAAYATLWKDRVTAMQRAAGLSKVEIDAFGDSVRRYSSDNGGLKRYMAEYYAAKDASGKLKAEPTPEGGLKVNAALAAELTKAARQQVTKSGKQLPAFDPTKFVKTGDVVGLKKAAAAKVVAESGSNEPPAQFEQLRKAVAKVGDNKKPIYAYAVIADEILNLESTAAVVLFPAEGKLPTPPAKAALVAKWQNIADLAAAVVAGLTEPEKFVRDEHLTDLLWKQGK